MVAPNASFERRNGYRIVGLFLNFCAKTVGKKFVHWNFEEILLFIINITFELKFKVTEDNLY